MEAYDQTSEPEEPPPAFPPAGVTLPDGSEIPGSGEVALATEAGVQNVGPFWFCFFWNDRPWGHLSFWAPGPNEAALSAQSVVPLLQAAVDRHGYRNVTIGVRAGQCS